MAKKSDRWQGDDFAVANPFAALAKGGAQTSETPEKPAKTAEKPADVKLVVQSARIERAHRSGKTVTIVSFRNSPDDAQIGAWLKKAKAALGCGGTIEDGKAVLQGDRVENVKKL